MQQTPIFLAVEQRGAMAGDAAADAAAQRTVAVLLEHGLTDVRSEGFICCWVVDSFGVQAQLSWVDGLGRTPLQTALRLARLGTASAMIDAGALRVSGMRRDRLQACLQAARESGAADDPVLLARVSDAIRQRLQTQ
jgi:hypothetical protein